MSQIYTVGTLHPLCDATYTEGTVVNWDQNLNITGAYTMRLNIPGQGDVSLNLRGVDFGGNENDKVCVVGTNSLHVDAVNPEFKVNLNSSFILCFDRNINSGVLTTDWNKMISLNLQGGYIFQPNSNIFFSFNPGWEHIEMDSTYIYVATRGWRMLKYRTDMANNHDAFDNQYMIFSPSTPIDNIPTRRAAAIAKFRISDGAIMWMKQIEFLKNYPITVPPATPNGYAKGITSITLRPDALYASLTVGTSGDSSNLNEAQGYDYLKINPVNGYVSDQPGIINVTDMLSAPYPSNVGDYTIIDPTTYELYTTYSATGRGAYSQENIILRTPGLEDQISDQWGINPTSTKWRTSFSSFSSSVIGTSNSVCNSTLNQTYYFDGSGSVPAVNDTVYYSSSPPPSTSYLPAGYYRISTANRYIIVGSNGNVNSINICVLTQVTDGSAVTTGQPFEACFDSVNISYWHDGFSALPIVGDTCYTSLAGTTVLASGWRRRDSSNRMLINISGSIDSIVTC
tara:strand:+ start:734 stop:2269 length:1536 start_codon:yes stop_codon:yes gene_type:complete